MQARRVRGERRFRVADRRHRLDLRDDQLGGVRCAVRSLGDHHRERLADVAHPVGREDRARRREQRAAVGILERQLAQDRAVAGAREVGRGVDREHAGQRRAAADIDAAQPAVGMGRADDARGRLARQRDVVGVAPRPRTRRGSSLRWTGWPMPNLRWGRVTASFMAARVQSFGCLRLPGSIGARAQRTTPRSRAWPLAYLMIPTT